MICIADKSTKLRSGCSYGRLKRQAERRHFFSAELWGCAYFRTKQFKASPLPNAAIPTTRDGASAMMDAVVPPESSFRYTQVPGKRAAGGTFGRPPRVLNFQRQ